MILIAITCLAIDEARKEGKVVSLEPLWKQFEVDKEIEKLSAK